MTGFADRWAANSHLYANSITTFLEDQWIVRDAPPGMELGPDNTIRLMLHQKEILEGGFLTDEKYPAFFDRDSDGRLTFDLMVYSAPKKSGKTEIEGGAAEHTALTFPGTPELYFIGNDKEQAQTRAFAAIGMQINPNSKAFNPTVAQHFVIPNRFTQSLARVDLKAGGFLKSIPIDYAGEAGSAPTATFWDELWGADRESQERLWAEMTPPPTVRDAFRFVATYAGFRGESKLLWDIYNRIVGDKPHERKKRRVHPTLPIYVSPDGNAIAYWDDGAEARRMPWQAGELGKRYYDREKSSLRESDFNRLHLNRWQDHAEAFIKAEAWDALPRYVRAAVESWPVYAFVDAAHKRDTTSGVAVQYTPFKTPTGRPVKRLLEHRIWRPSKGNVVIPEDTALPWLESLIARRNVKAIGFDPNHFETPAERLRKSYRRLDIRDVTQSQGNLVAMGQTLYDDIAFRSLEVYEEDRAADDTVRAHVLNAKAIHGPQGYRLVKDKDSMKIDAGMALSGALMLANERGAKDLEKRSPIHIFGGDEDDEEIY